MALNISLSASQPLEIPLLTILSLAFCIGLFGMFVFNFLSSLYIWDISILSAVGLMKIFFQSVGCCSVLLMVSFALQKLCSFMRSHLLIVDLSA